MRRAIRSHLGSPQVSRVIYGAIIGLAVIVATQAHPPSPGVVAATLVGTAVAVGLAELYSEVLGLEARRSRHITRAELRNGVYNMAAVAAGIAFPAVVFVLAAAGAIEEKTAFKIADWSGVGLITLYGYAAARRAGESVLGSAIRALAVALIGAFLILLKAVLH